MTDTGNNNLIGLSLDELKAALAALGLEPFRAKQVWSWMYCHGAKDFAGMSNLAKPVREKLAEHFALGRPSITAHQKSEDGTQKWLLRMNDGQEVECVHIPEEDRGALCVSSQVGCPMGCTFCHTGTQRLVRNLTAGEIVGQVLLTRDMLGEWPGDSLPLAGRVREGGHPLSAASLTGDSAKRNAPPPNLPREGGGTTAQSRAHEAQSNRALSNIVMMGMGEPLNNFDNVAKALKIVMHPDGIAIGRRKITLSTSGVVPMIRRCGEELGVNLAISLHASTDEVRDKLMPINRKHPIKELLQACRDYPGASNARRITFEYVMLKGVNDSPADARALVKLLAGIPAKINLLPYNPWPGSPFECSDEDTIRKFGDIVNRAGYVSPVRTPRGRDIMAACGQLKSASERVKS
ncbi:MAG: 23S rRNA (adenine(2503)-C(2))-methyltransferase RlmN [Alphaproteobacteria bacterium]|nr:23S rRNA (adenine(2503)-C(2))-methyltransferase RlmN [Alphaproteobacteria bacterium]